MADRADLWVCRLGTVPYREALALQHAVRDARGAGTIPDTLLLLEHPPVYTRGRRSDPADLPMGEAWCRSQGIDVVDVDRGGRLTYHGPGQLVGYPIMAVRDVVAHLRTMEAAIVAALADEGIEAHARPQDGPDFTGVWVQERKIASLGVHLARGISTHGFAVNVENDLQPFEWAVPCGLAGVRIGYLCGRTALIDEIDKVRPPYNVSALNAECALFALEHAQEYARQAALLREQRARLQRELAAIPGLTTYPSEANMILVRVPDARRAFEGMKQRGVLVKHIAGLHPLLANCLRLTVGTPEENTLMIDALKASL